MLLILESRVIERLYAVLGIRYQGGQLGEPKRSHPVLDGGEETAAYPLPAPAFVNGEKDNPALVMGGARNGGTDYLIAVNSNNGVVLLAGCNHFRERIDRLHSACLGLFPQVQDRVHVRRVKVPGAPTRHCVAPRPPHPL